MGTNNVKYFLRGENPSIIWDAKNNSVAAMCTNAGVFATEDKRVAEMLTALGYKPVDRAKLAELDLAVPKPDRTDYVARGEGGKYTPFE